MSRPSWGLGSCACDEDWDMDDPRNQANLEQICADNRDNNIDMIMHNSHRDLSRLRDDLRDAWAKYDRNGRRPADRAEVNDIREEIRSVEDRRDESISFEEDIYDEHRRRQRSSFRRSHRRFQRRGHRW